MSAEDAGSIYSEVRIRLDKLQSDITQAVNAIDKFGKSVLDMGNTASNLFSNSYSKSIANVKTYLSSLDDAVKQGALTQKQAIEQSIAVRKQEIAFIQATAAQKGGFTTREISDLKATNAELVKLENQYKELTASEKQAGTEATSFSTASVAAAAVVAVAFRSLVTATSEYSGALASVKAATRASADEMAQFAAIADETAKQYGKTNTETLGGIEALAKAGVSTADILNGALSGSLALAAAGELSVGDAAEAAAGIMTQFGKTGSDVAHIADLLAASAGKAIGDVSDFTMAFKQVGLVSAKTGLSLEETTGVLAAFASNSLLGSDAGTSLKTMLANLVPVSKEAGDLMKKIGFSAYDANGKFVGMANVAEQLKTKLGGLTDAEKSEYLQTLFGNDGKRAAIVLLEQGSKGIDEWISKVNDQGFAAETAAIRLDSLDGDLQKLSASTTSVASSFGDAATPAMRGMAQVATVVLNALSALPGPVKVALVTIGGLTAAILAFAAAGPSVIGVIKGIGLAAATSLGPFGLIASAASILAVGLGAAAVSAGAFQSSSDKMISKNAELIATMKESNDQFSKIVGPVNDSTRANKLSADQIDQLKKLYPDLSRVIDLNKSSIEDVTRAQKGLNAERNKDTISLINKQIEENNKIIESNTNATNDRSSAQKANADLMLKYAKNTIASYEAQKTHTKAETEAYNLAKQRIEQINESNLVDNQSLSLSKRTADKYREKNRLLQAQIKELDGTAEAEREAAAARAQAYADEQAAITARKQAIERELQLRKNQSSEYENSKIVYKQLLSEKLIDEETYYKKLLELSNGRISAIQDAAVKDGKLSNESKVLLGNEIKLRDEASAKLDAISKKKKEAEDQEKALQSALNGTIESLIKQRDELINTGVMTEAQTALADKLSKKIIELQNKEKNAVQATEEEKRKAQELTANFRQAYSDGLIDQIDVETNKKKDALDKEIKNLRDANAIMLAADKEYANQSEQITKYSEDQKAKIEADSLNKRISSVSDYVSKAGSVFQSLFTALGSLFEAMNQQQIDALDDNYTKLTEELDAETEARLEAAGVNDQTALESAQKQLEDAQATGDAETIAKAEDELKKQQILADAAAKKLAIDKQYEHDKAQLQYKASLEAWNLQLLNAIAATAVSVVNALQTQPIWLGIAMAAVAGVIGGVQIAAVAGAKPKPPALATGGIAIPQSGGQGAQVLVAENGSPEMMLNGGASGEPFVNAFADKIAERINRSVTAKDITLINEINSIEISRAVASDIDNGKVRLKATVR